MEFKIKKSPVQPIGRAGDNDELLGKIKENQT